jgi:hypothetical protein
MLRQSALSAVLGAGLAFGFFGLLPDSLPNPFESPAEAGVKSVERRTLRKEERKLKRKERKQKRVVKKEERQTAGIKRELKKLRSKKK